MYMKKYRNITINYINTGVNYEVDYVVADTSLVDFFNMVSKWNFRENKKFEVGDPVELPLTKEWYESPIKFIDVVKASDTTVTPVTTDNTDSTDK